MEREKCWKCDNLSTITVQASGHFCDDCFVEYFRHKYKRVLGASKLIRKGDVVVFAFDGSLASCAMLDILEVFQIQVQKSEDQDSVYKKKSRYITKVLHLDIQSSR